jgi:hypothetical protein
VLRGVDLDLRPGQAVGVIGENALSVGGGPAAERLLAALLGAQFAGR